MVNQRRFLVLTLILFGILLIFGCGEEKITGPEVEFQLLAAPPSSLSASKYIGPKGGKIKLKDGSKLIVPEGALDLKTKITVSKVLDTEYDLAYEFGPSGLIFNNCALFEIPFALFEGDIEEKAKLVTFHSEDGKKIKRTHIDYDIDWDEEIVIFYIPHFTYYYFPW